jgi:hypothetical protein
VATVLAANSALFTHALQSLPCNSEERLELIRIYGSVSLRLALCVLDLIDGSLAASSRATSILGISLLRVLFGDEQKLALGSGWARGVIRGVDNVLTIFLGLEDCDQSIATRARLVSWPSTTPMNHLRCILVLGAILGS